jgi:hypothetical protein
MVVGRFSCLEDSDRSATTIVHKEASFRKSTDDGLIQTFLHQVQATTQEGGARMHPGTKQYNEAQTPNNRAICELLTTAPSQLRL